MTDSETSRNDGNDHVSKRRTPIPKFQVAIVLLIQFAEPITALVIYPFVVQFVRDTGITGGEETKTGFYADCLYAVLNLQQFQVNSKLRFQESAFFLAESLTVSSSGAIGYLWAKADTAVGTIRSDHLNAWFWDVQDILVLFFFRCIQGACNGNIGVSKTVINEIRRILPIYIYNAIIWAWPVLSRASPLSSSHLPLIGVANTLGKIEVLREHPYLLPCGIAASVALLSFAAAFIGLKETLPSIVARSRKNTSAPAETDPLLPRTTPETQDAPPPVRDLFIRPVFIALANHGLLSFCHMANEALIPLFFATPISLGGLGLKPYDIGLILGICGICNAIVQVLFGGRVIRRFGPRRTFIAGFCALMVEFAMYPLISFLAQRAGRVDSAVRIALACQLSCTFVLYFSYASTMLFIMDAAPSRASLGSVNGLAQMVGTVLRSIAPSFSSSLFALSAEHQIAGGNLVYFVLIAATLCAVRCSLLLPRKLRSESKE
ncbi:major facilitator superfamily domain-containing protein [Mycena leptocephala]|nr:major facilitator superfamily domain-containing protein [Mycena leptocephala]